MTRKIKNLRRYSYDPTSTVTVELEEHEHWNSQSGDRLFKVYAQDGTYIGEIESGEGQRSRHLFGNVAHFYKRRTYWYDAPAGSSGNRYGIKNESQAEAIRSLLSSAGIR